MRRKGFSLIELLVVIAIIAILAAILFPIITQAKERGRQMGCLANLKQLGTAFRLYADDHEGAYPASSPLTNTPGITPINTPTDWCGSIYNVGCVLENGQIWKYGKGRKMYLCPTDLGIAPKSWSAPKNYPLSYSMNSWMSLLRQDGIKNQRVSRIMLLLHESRLTINDGKYSMWSTDDLAAVHWEGTTLLYCDGHARWGSRRALLAEKAAGYWNPTLLMK